MLPGGPISRWISQGGLCCLVVLGGLPRAWCQCPDEACRAECNTGAGLLTPPALNISAAGCTCCARSKPVGDLPADAPHLASADCACEMQVTQLVLVTAERDALIKTPGDTFLTPGVDVAALSSDLSVDLVPGQFAGLPPDDPVSRAQILRL